MAWLRRGRGPGRPDPRPLVEPDPLRTPEDARETGLLIGILKNPWSAVVVKNLEDRRIATGESPSSPPAGPHAAGEAAGRRATDE